MIAVEEREKTGLGPGCPLRAAEGEFVAAPFELGEVEREVEQPQAGSLAHGGELGGLEMREAERRLVLPCLREPAQGVDDRRQRFAELVQTLLHQDKVGV